MNELAWAKTIANECFGFMEIVHGTKIMNLIMVRARIVEIMCFGNLKFISVFLLSLIFGETTD